MTVKEIFQYNTGGIVYKDATGEILGTGTAQDSAGPDPENAKGIFIYCQSPARTLYAVADTPITYRVKNALAVTTTPNRDQFLAILSENFFFRVTGGAGAQNLDDVLTIGNNAGANDIDMNAQDIFNIDELETKVIKTQLLSNLEIKADLDIILNPNGSIDANGKVLNMSNGEIHNVPLVHGKNNNDLIIEGKGTGAVILKTNNANKLTVTDSGFITTQVGLAPKTIIDGSGVPGTLNQVLKSTVTGIKWEAPTDPAGWNVIVLSANQDVINTIVPQDITEFQFSVVANGHYMVEMDVCWSGNDPTGDYQSNFLVTAGVMKAYGISLVSDQATPRLITCSSAAIAQLGQFQLISSDIDFLMSAKANFNFNCTQNATFKFQVRNAVAAAGRISRTWKGSILKYKRID